MKIQWTKFHYILIVLIPMLVLAGCALRRDETETQDAEPLGGGIPPTLAPLGADSAELVGDSPSATAIDVDPTATISSGEGGINAGSDEINLPTSQPVDLSGEAVSDTGAAEAIVEPETFTPPAEGASAVEPVIVDVSTENLPTGGPIAVNPPASQTAGSYAAPAAPIPGSGGDYVVRPGDTLFSLSLAFDTNVQAIMLANGLSSETIYAGQTLSIPGYDGLSAPVYAPTPGDGTVHVVSDGETLFNIALSYGTSVEALALANGIPAPFIIYPGQQLTIATVPGSSVAPGGFGQTHTVAPGETLFFIAQRYGVTTQALTLANGLTNPNQIRAGQVLTIP